MTRNFYFSGPVVGELFFNRKELGYLLENVRFANFDVVGPPLSGKTSLLKQLVHEGRRVYPHIQWVYVDMLCMRSPQEVWGEIRKQIGKPAGFSLAGIQQYIAQHPTVIILDEIDCAERRGFPRDFFENISLLARQGIVVSRTVVNSALPGFRPVYLYPLRRGEIIKMLQEYGVNYRDASWIADHVKERYPYHAQLLGAFLKDEKSPKNARKRALKKYYLTIGSNPRTHLLTLLDTASLVLSALSMLLLDVSVFLYFFLPHNQPDALTITLLCVAIVIELVNVILIVTSESIKTGLEKVLTNVFVFVAMCIVIGLLFAL